MQIASAAIALVAKRKLRAFALPGGLTIAGVKACFDLGVKKNFARKNVPGRGGGKRWHWLYFQSSMEHDAYL